MLSVVIMLCYRIVGEIVRITHNINGILPALPRVVFLVGRFIEENKYKKTF